MSIPRPLFRPLVPIVAFALVACAGEGLQSPEPPQPVEVATPSFDVEASVVCNAGSYDDGGVCVLAPAGHFVPSAGATSAIPCPAGQFQPHIGTIACFDALPGGYVPTTGATTLLLCPLGTFSGSSGASACTPAPAGRFVAVEGATGARACSPGTFQPNEGMTSCLASPPGTSVPSFAAAQPTPCSAGFYQPNPGQAACLPAPIGSYVAAVEATDATPCPVGKTTLATGATSAAQCVTIFTFTGFFAPVDNAPDLNVSKAGSAIPVKFSLGGNQGLDVMAPGYPTVQAIACNTLATLDVIEETVTAGKSSLQYDASTDRYTYVWKSEKSWASSCRRLTVRLTDGTTKTADFMFK